jgi:hypothetical protein
MVEEIEMDAKAGTLYLSPWLTGLGKQEWPQLLRDAAMTGSDASLANELSRPSRLERTAFPRKPKGDGMVPYTVPVTAPETIAEGEFNRFYVRALCRRAIEDGVASLIVYRAKAVTMPRVGSEEKIGTAVTPTAILADLRNSVGVEPALGMPPGPNSGLTVRLP